MKGSSLQPGHCLPNKLVHITSFTASKFQVPGSMKISDKKTLLWNAMTWKAVHLIKSLKKNSILLSVILFYLHLKSTCSLAYARLTRAHLVPICEIGKWTTFLPTRPLLVGEYSFIEEMKKGMKSQGYLHRVSLTMLSYMRRPQLQMRKLRLNESSIPHSPRLSEPTSEYKSLSLTTLSPTFHMTQSLGHTGRKFVSTLFTLTVALLDSSCLLYLWRCEKAIVLDWCE